MINQLPSILPYLIESSLCMLAFYLLYVFAYKKDTFFQVNRFYLLGTLILALIIPFVILKDEVISQLPELLIDPITTASQAVVLEQTNLSIWAIVSIIYLIGLLITLSKFGFQMIRLTSIISKGEVKIIDRYQVISTEGNYPTSSFFKYILWDNKTENFDDNEVAGIISHELVHVKQKHSIDNLVTELVKCFFWFNPIVYFYDSELKIIHEFQADNKVVHQKKDLSEKEYEDLLGKQLLNNAGYQLSNNFNMSNLKKRLIMISKPKTQKIALIKNVLIIPIMLLMVVLVQESARAQITKEITPIESKAVERDGEKVNIITVQGSYTGKNLKVLNPYHPSGIGWSISRVLVNDKPIDMKVNTDAFEIDLSHFKKGDAIKVELIAAVGSLPKIVNPEDIR
jgi:bla regulator protein blaR1